MSIVTKKDIYIESNLIINSVTSTKDLKLLLVTDDQRKSVTSTIEKLKCNSSDLIEVDAFFHDKLLNVPREISLKGAKEPFFFIVYRCYNSLSNFKVKYCFRNPWGFLNIDGFIILIINGIETLFYLVVSILYLINRLHHPLITTKLHKAVYFSTVLVFVFTVLMTLTLFVMDISFKSATNNSLLNLIDAFKSLRFGVLTGLTLLVASGLSIIKEEIGKKRTIVILVLSSVYVIVYFFATSEYSLTFSIGVMITVQVLFLLSYIVYGFVFTKMSKKSINILTMHLIMISEAGIDPKTTPSHRKLVMMQKIRIGSLLIFVCELFSGLLYSTKLLSFLIAYIVLSFLEAILFSCICYMLRLRNAMASTYCDDENVYVVNDDEELDQETCEKWTYGQPLPPMPTTAQDPKKVYGGD